MCCEDIVNVDCVTLRTYYEQDTTSTSLRKAKMINDDVRPSRPRMSTNNEILKQ